MTSIFKINGTPIAQVAAECADALEETVRGGHYRRNKGTLLGMASDLRQIQIDAANIDKVEEAGELRECLGLILAALDEFFPTNCPTIGRYLSEITEEFIYGVDEDEE